MLLYRRLSDAYGLQCRMHKDGLNAVLHCTEAPNGRDGGAHSFFFSYGCVVTWGLSEAQEQERLQLQIAKRSYPRAVPPFPPLMCVHVCMCA